MRSEVSTKSALPLRGIAVAHRESNKLAVWCLAMTGPASVDAVNAVVVGVDDISTIEAVLHRQILVGVVDGLPEGLLVNGFRSVEDVVEALRSATGALQQDILAAILSYEKRKRTRLIRPDWVRHRAVDFGAAPTDLVGRTLKNANLVKAQWQEWLETEKQRLRWSRSPRTGETPYIMPAELSILTIRPLPPSLGESDMAVPMQKAMDLAVEE